MSGDVGGSVAVVSGSPQRVPTLRTVQQGCARTTAAAQGAALQASGDRTGPFAEGDVFRWLKHAAGEP